MRMCAYVCASAVNTENKQKPGVLNGKVTSLTCNFISMTQTCDNSYGSNIDTDLFFYFFKWRCEERKERKRCPTCAGCMLMYSGLKSALENISVERVY